MKTETIIADASAMDELLGIDFESLNARLLTGKCDILALKRKDTRTELYLKGFREYLRAMKGHFVNGSYSNENDVLRIVSLMNVCLSALDDEISFKEILSDSVEKQDYEENSELDEVEFYAN